MSDFTSKIQSELLRIEHEEQVRIVYACESGSRAWGFPSQDSDYDVRFLYVRPTDWYLSILEKRDVIERPISEQLDINGWDLKKALNLFRKSNPSLLEWLESPISYMERYTVAQQIRELSPLLFSPRVSIYHYLHMAKRNYRHYLQGEIVQIKKYFYVLRPILACIWILERGSIAPVDHGDLIAGLQLEPALEREINKLILRKKAGEEFDLEPGMNILNDYLEKQIACLEEVANLNQAPTGAEKQDNVLDDLFRKALREVWQ
ncbi:nucleotidyltransferase domain-containing protein [Paenibacillus sp. LMG 31456]|uniref:Nucleotidyltransferase domain-containing protein n=1 Tax=Paenibacillus foliorum TaxID=2654974 RepID=A0A972GUJ4_9BACL|nr:nucleotidyltransferase domain-containing protein [Paenibacillus foliorum]NOU94473.1 nucleotidyltransferase domain-containing protein [Paenibacillus foliorum]